VLNALRHQRLGNQVPGQPWGTANKCSTPCGINGWETPEALSCGVAGFFVLNALRHQRLGNVLLSILIITIS